MVEIRMARLKDVEGIAKVCIDANRDTYKYTHSEEFIERTISEFYNYKRIKQEVLHTSSSWQGWFVAIENDKVVGAIGGGMINDEKGEIFVLYLDINKRREGIGTLLLNYLTDIQKKDGALEQWVSVAKGNQKGIPFYEAKGFKRVKEIKSFESAENENYTSYRYSRNI
ncbi:GNAT family N-acetyltransferase [Lentibacillus sp. L22]|nr:GNAT family N-acetyltransferase [Lentibacillus daqui]